MKGSKGAIALAVVTACVLMLPIPSASAAPSPWWQIVTGSRPSNLWEPEDAVQEISTKPAEGAGLVVPFQVKGENIGCFGAGASAFLCGFFGLPLVETAAQLKPVLETAYGGPVEVTGGPVGENPMIVTVPGRNVPPVTFTPLLGEASNNVISPGGSGRLVVTLTNIGDEKMDASTIPLKIVDELPAGTEVTAFETVAGTKGNAGPVDCVIEGVDKVVCGFEGVLERFDSIEVELLVNLTGSPPSASAPGKVSVSGGNAPAASEIQSVSVSPEPTEFGIERFAAESEVEGGDPAVQAGGHPLQTTTTVQFNAGKYVAGPSRSESTVEQPAQPRNVRVTLPVGIAGNPSVLPTCSLQEFYEQSNAMPVINLCPDAAAVGVASVLVVVKGGDGFLRLAVPIFNLPPAAGEPARLGFSVLKVPTVINTKVDPDNKYRVIASVNNTSQLPRVLSATLTIWGAPGDPRHDSARGWGCAYTPTDVGPCERPANLSEAAFLRQPVSCATPLEFEAEAEPWNTPLGSLVDHAVQGGPFMSGCNQVPFLPEVTATPTSKLAGNPSGFDFQLDMPNAGLLNKDAIAEGQAKRVEVTLPQGMTINPSQGEGLVGCSSADLARETSDSAPGAGCPQASKVGELQISTPLLKEEAQGSVYVASPYDNPFGSLIALYMVAKIPERGILVKQAGVVRPDPSTGQLRTVFDDLPQIPFTTVKLNLRAGARSPLVTPPACGSYDVVAKFTPWSASDPDNPKPEEIITRTSSFDVERGVDGGACPNGSTPPFLPKLFAGTINNAAKSYSPFNVRLTRKDGEQEFTNFSIKLPPGVIGKLAGIPFCSDAAIAVAKGRTGPKGAQEELDSPSCPAASQVGRTLAGSGVGASLTYVPGKIYLAGPFNGAPLSVVAITAAKVGPFDLGTVVVRQALRINPETAEVFVDPTGSDPLPHIIQGIEVHLRDIRVYVDRPEFVLNPTNCDRTSTASTVLGSGLDFGSAADNVPVTVTSPFQAADCASLGFKPRLQLSLRGKTRRGGNPALRAVMRPRVGDANAARISVALPGSEFLDQSHIRTVCTRVQFKAGAGNGAECPRGAIYGRARAWTPLLDEPLEGPVFLRSSENPLPDMVLALHGLVDVHAVGRIDSVNGGIRTTFDFVPDAPITKVVLRMGGGRKSLLENSTNVCRGKHLATVKMKGHNGAVRNFGAPLKAKCGKAKKQAKRQAKR